MKKHSVRYNNLLKLIDINKKYDIKSAINLLKTSLYTTKFNESLEAHIFLNINSKNIKHQIKSSLFLPFVNENKKRIAIFTEDDPSNIELLNLGANIVGFKEILDNLNSGNINFDILVTKPNLMVNLAKFGKILGPKGLMPSPKSGTVTQNLKDYIIDFKKGKLEYKSDKTGNIHFNLGKISFNEIELFENFRTLIISIEKNKPVGIKNKYIKQINLSTTMSPNIKINISNIKNFV